ncbi:hypothetical protein ACHAXM_010741 [Skeletonema potamos]
MVDFVAARVTVEKNLNRATLNKLARQAMNPSNLQQLINDKETELTKIRSLANEAALQREHEAKEETQRMLLQMEREVERIQRESEDTINRVTQQVENEAQMRIRNAMHEMEQYLECRQNEIHAAASLKMEKSWQGREDSLKKEVHLLLKNELDRQHDTLAAHYEGVIHSKDCNMKLVEEEMKQQLAKAEERHRTEIDAMKQQLDKVANEIWTDAREQFAAAADEEIERSRAATKSQCKQLIDENSELRRSLDEKERVIKDNFRVMKDMEDTFQDVASEVNRMHTKEMDDISNQASRLMQDNARLKNALHEIGAENDHLKDELDQIKMMNRSLEVKCKDQLKVLDTVDMSKSESISRINELTVCNELLKRQMTDIVSENKALVAENEKQRIVVNDLSCENKKQASAIDDLRETNQSREARGTTLEQKLHEARQQILSLEQENEVYATQTNQLLERNDRLHSEMISMYEKKLSASKEEANLIVSDLSSECNSLRSRILQLQRDNFRLEQDLMDSHQRKQRYRNHDDDVSKPEHPSQDTHKLNDENKALKEIISMMRAEMESAVSDESPSESSREGIIERQLSLCRAYLDLLLNTRDARSTKYDELTFLRSKNRELLQMIDEMRHASLVNHSRQPCRTDVPSMQEQRLISRLEEATYEIEELLQERDQLMKLSNELKFELQQANQKAHKSISTSNMREHEPRTHEDEGAGQILDAILNDFSASYDGESHEESEAVACIGTKPPTGNTTNISRPKTATDRATSSQKESYQRMLKSIKKKQAALQKEKAKIRNWSIKG